MNKERSLVRKLGLASITRTAEQVMAAAAVVPTQHNDLPAPRPPG